MDRNALLEHLETAKRHVAEGNVILAEQRKRVAEMRRNGFDTAVAETLLAQFQHTQALHVSDVERLTNELRRIEQDGAKEGLHAHEE